MTARERLMAVASGREVDKKPVIGWPIPADSADLRVGPEGDLFPVRNLYRKLELMGKDPAALMQENSAGAQELIDKAETESKRESERAIANGALGVLYEIHGATASQCTPMQYGGLFLERDRAFLDYISKAACNVVYVNGKEPYLDFISDLPAQAFAWDVKGSGVPVAEVRKMRSGALAADDPEADFLLCAEGSITDALEGVMAHV